MLNGIKSKYILEHILSYVDKALTHKLFRYNKNIQSKINLSINDYKLFSKIIIEVYTTKFIFDKNLFINFEQKYKPYYHIYFNDNEKEKENYPINLDMTKMEPIKHFFRSNFQNNENEIIKGFYYGKDKIKKIKIVIDNEVKTLKGLFKNCSSFKEINFIQFNRKNINDMSEMFYGCTSLIKINLNNFKTDNVTNMSDMFGHCGLRSLKLPKLFTSKVINMNYMFSDCEYLLKLDLTGLDTSNVTKMACMFQECTRLEKINISNFDTRKVFDMSQMFTGCFSLKNLDISKFNTKNVEDMSKMFDGCCSIEELNLENFCTDNITDMSNMFNGCQNLKNLYIKNFNIPNLIDINGVFNGCIKLNINDLMKNIKRKIIGFK